MAQHGNQTAQEMNPVTDHWKFSNPEIHQPRENMKPDPRDDAPIAGLRLDLFKAGAPVVALKRINGKIEYRHITSIDRWDEKSKCWLSEGRAVIPPDGAGYYAMTSCKGGPHFYYSANPDHIREAEKQFEEARKEREAKKEYDQARLQEFKEKLDDLVKQFGVAIYPEQIAGDDCGVEIDLCISINNEVIVVDY